MTALSSITLKACQLNYLREAQKYRRLILCVPVRQIKKMIPFRTFGMILNDFLQHEKVQICD